MNKKTILLTVVLLLVAALCIGCGRAGSRQEEASQGAGKENQEALGGTEGVEDSIFDDETPPENDTSSEDQSSVDKDEDDVEKPPKPSDNTTTPDPDTDATQPPATDDAQKPDAEMTYEKFMALTPTEQREHQESFNDIEAFFNWYNAAKEKYEKEHPSIEVDGPIDMDKITGGNG